MVGTSPHPHDCFLEGMLLTSSWGQQPASASPPAPFGPVRSAIVIAISARSLTTLMLAEPPQLRSLMVRAPCSCFSQP